MFGAENEPHSALGCSRAAIDVVHVVQGPGVSRSTKNAGAVEQIRCIAVSCGQSEMRIMLHVSANVQVVELHPMTLPKLGSWLRMTNGSTAWPTDSPKGIHVVVGLLAVGEFWCPFPTARLVSGRWDPSRSCRIPVSDCECCEYLTRTDSSTVQNKEDEESRQSPLDDSSNGS